MSSGFWLVTFYRFAIYGPMGMEMLAMDNIWSRNFLKSIDPRPEAGSHPAVASKPSLQHVMRPVQLFLPTVMSLKNSAWSLYSVGLMKPTGLPPPRRRAAFTREIMPAKVGVESDVPPMPMKMPPTTAMKLLASTATSGKALPPLV